MGQVAVEYWETEGFLVVNTRSGEMKVMKREPKVGGHEVFFRLTVRLPEMGDEVGKVLLTVPPPPDPNVDVDVFSVPGLEVEVEMGEDDDDDDE